MEFLSDARSYFTAKRWNFGAFCKFCYQLPNFPTDRPLRQTLVHSYWDELLQEFFGGDDPIYQEKAAFILAAVRQNKLTKINNINNNLYGNGLINCKLDGGTVNVIQKSSAPQQHTTHIQAPTFSALDAMSGDEDLPSTTVLSPCSSRLSSPGSLQGFDSGEKSTKKVKTRFATACTNDNPVDPSAPNLPNIPYPHESVPTSHPTSKLPSGVKRKLSFSPSFDQHVVKKLRRVEEDHVRIKTTATELSESTWTPHFVDGYTQNSSNVSKESASSSPHRTPYLPNSTQAAPVTTFQAESKGVSTAGTLDGESRSSEFDFVLQFAHKFVSMMSQAKKEREEIFARFDELNNKMDILLSRAEGPK